jgi:hypothetical protein
LNVEQQVYMLELAPDEALIDSVRQHLALEGETPQHVRLATNSPLTNRGWPASASGYLLRLDGRGAVVGTAGNNAVPRMLVPWQNIAYLAEGAPEI